MARAVKTAAPPPVKRYHCKDCAHSYDWNSVALDGHLILCRCKLDEKTKHGVWCKFLSDLECEHYKPRKA